MKRCALRILSGFSLLVSFGWHAPSQAQDAPPGYPARPIRNQQPRPKARGMRQSAPNHARRRAKSGRSSRGTVNTYCRCGAGASTFSSTHLPWSSTRFWWQLGQK